MPKGKKPTKKEAREEKQALKKMKKEENTQAEYDACLKELDEVDHQLSDLEKFSLLRLEKNNDIVQSCEKDCGHLDANQINALTLGIQLPTALATKCCLVEQKFNDVKWELTDNKFKKRTAHQDSLESLRKRFEAYHQMLPKLQDAVMRISTIKRRDAVRKLTGEIDAATETLSLNGEDLTPATRQAVEDALRLRERVDNELKSLDTTIGMGGNKDLIPDREQLAASKVKLDTLLSELVQKHHQTMKSEIEKQLTQNQSLVALALFGNPPPALDAVQEKFDATFALISRAEMWHALENTVAKCGLSVANLTTESFGWSQKLDRECLKLSTAGNRLKQRLTETNTHDHPVPYSGFLQGSMNLGTTQFSSPENSTIVPVRKNS